MSKTPIKNSYWVVTDQFLAGEYPRNLDDFSSVGKISALIDAGVKVFIDLTEETEDLIPYSSLLEKNKSKGIIYRRFPIRDYSVPKSQALTRSILDAIDRHLGEGELVYLHCWGGIGRTGTIVGCWLSRHGYPGEAALARLRELWQQSPKSINRKSPETIEQEAYIVDWVEETN